MTANEASAVGSLRVINTAAVTYQSTYANGYPSGLQALGSSDRGPETCNHADLIDNSLASGQKSGYVFTFTPQTPVVGTQPALSPEAAAKGCTAPGAAAYNVAAEPITRGTTGQRSFFTDQTGVIRYEIDGPATANSPPLE